MSIGPWCERQREEIICTESVTDKSEQESSSRTDQVAARRYRGILRLSRGGESTATANRMSGLRIAALTLVVFCGVSSAASAGTITKVSASPSVAVTGQTVTFTEEGTNPCGASN